MLKGNGTGKSSAERPIAPLIERVFSQRSLHMLGTADAPVVKMSGEEQVSCVCQSVEVRVKLPLGLCAMGSRVLPCVAVKAVCRHLRRFA